MENLEGASLPPGGREPPEAQRLALLRELSTFITWCGHGSCASLSDASFAVSVVPDAAFCVNLHVCSRHENLVQLFGWCVQHVTAALSGGACCSRCELIPP